MYVASSAGDSALYIDSSHVSTITELCNLNFKLFLAKPSLREFTWGFLSNHPICTGNNNIGRYMYIQKHACVDVQPIKS